MWYDTPYYPYTQIFFVTNYFLEFFFLTRWWECTTLRFGDAANRRVRREERLLLLQRHQRQLSDVVAVEDRRQS